MDIIIDIIKESTILFDSYKLPSVEGIMLPAHTVLTCYPTWPKVDLTYIWEGGNCEPRITVYRTSPPQAD